MNNSSVTLKPTLSVPEKPQELPWKDIQEAVESIRYGTVQLVIHDGRIVQIDKTEKIRLS